MLVFRIGSSSGFEAETRKRSPGIASKARVHSATEFWQMGRGGGFLKIRGLCRLLFSIRLLYLFVVGYVLYFLLRPDLHNST